MNVIGNIQDRVWMLSVTLGTDPSTIYVLYVVEGFVWGRGAVFTNDDLFVHHSWAPNTSVHMISVPLMLTRTYADLWQEQTFPVFNPMDAKSVLLCCLVRTDGPQICFNARPNGCRIHRDTLYIHGTRKQDMCAFRMLHQKKIVCQIPWLAAKPRTLWEMCPNVAFVSQKFIREQKHHPIDRRLHGPSPEPSFLQIIEERHYDIFKPVEW